MSSLPEPSTSNLTRSSDPMDNQAAIMAMLQIMQQQQNQQMQMLITAILNKSFARQCFAQSMCWKLGRCDWCGWCRTWHVCWSFSWTSWCNSNVRPQITADQLLKNAADINPLEIVASPLRKGFVLMAPDKLFAWSREAYAVFSDAIKIIKLTLDRIRIWDQRRKSVLHGISVWRDSNSRRNLQKIVLIALRKLSESLHVLNISPICMKANRMLLSILFRVLNLK